jgi:transcriptional regulator with XRE-family HTH domain
VSESLAWVVGANCRRIRTGIGITQDDLALYARDLGLRWTASKVGDFESGRYAPAFATVLVVLLALNLAAEDAPPDDGEATGELTLADLLVGNGLIALTDALDVPGDQLAGVCQGQAFQAPKRHRGFVRGTWRDAQTLVEPDAQEMEQRSGLTEYRLAQRLGISPGFLAAKSFNLWGRTFSEERDRRAGPKANQQKRGRVSRELRAELEIALADGNDQ